MAKEILKASRCALVSALVLATGVAFATQGANRPATTSSGSSPSAVIVGTMTVTGTQTVAVVGSCSRVSVTATATITGVVDDGSGMDQVVFNLWDDGTIMASESFNIPVGSTQTVTAALNFDGTYGVGGAGVGVYLDDMPGGANLATMDPFIPTDVPGNCGGGTPTPAVALPSSSTISLIALAGLALLAGVFGVRRRTSLQR